MHKQSNNLSFIGLQTQYPTADDRVQTRIHLDGAASPLALTSSVNLAHDLLPHYSNTHSYVHASAQISSRAFDWAHKQVLEHFAADPDHYAAVFVGSGTTAALNRIARGLKNLRSDRPKVLISSMEHHANDLPHRMDDNQIHYIPLTGTGAQQGAVDTKALEKLCAEHAYEINYIAVSIVSNVTGIRNPIEEICRIAHRYNILVVADAAQSAAHTQHDIAELGVDFLVFSGHKVYTPMSPGVMLARKQLLSQMQGQDVGGGAVSDVTPHDYVLQDEVSEKEEAGTPNIIGAIALANSLCELRQFGLEELQKREAALMSLLQKELGSIPEVIIYGDSELPRIAALAFNHQNIEHGLLAAILNDYHAIAVRNECFCAHPYVSSMLKEELWQMNLDEYDLSEYQMRVNQRRGMVRVSLSAYNTKSDIQIFIARLKEIVENIDSLRENYAAMQDGSYKHKSYELQWREFAGLPS